MSTSMSYWMLLSIQKKRLAVTTLGLPSYGSLEAV